MKKVLFIAATATLFAFSCQKEMESVQTETIDGFSFSANAPALNNPGTKASINDSHGLVWAAGDKIGVYVDDSNWGSLEAKHNPFTLVGEGGSTSAQFIWDYDDGDFKSTLATVAFFPWQGRDNYGTYNHFSDNYVHIKLAGSYGNNNDTDKTPYTSGKMLTPLVASITRTGDAYDPIIFKHTGGAVKVKVSDLPAGAHSIGMTTASQQIQGYYKIAVADAGTTNMSLDGDAEPTKKTIWLNFEPTTSSRPFTFLFPVPALNENEKLSFQIYDKNDVLVWSRSVTTHPAINHGDVLLLGNDDAISIEPYRQLKEVSSEWGVCGSYNDWASDTKMMTDGTSCIATGLTLSKDATFKIRKDGAWTEQYGAYQLQNKGVSAVDANDDNKIKILADGTYDIVFQIDTKKVFVVPNGECPYPSKAHHYTAIKNATELGTTETANCYVITEAGSYKIPVVKGNDKSQSAGTVGGVELLWETYNNGTSVTKNSVIEAVDWDERTTDYIYFKTPDTLKPGNALIAAKDANGDIIWSWHIWIPETTITNIGEYAISSKYYMDRNLGALKVATASTSVDVESESFGMFYQWGRKDPFIGARAKGSGSLAKYTGTTQTGTSESVDMDYAIAHPTTMAKNNNWNDGITDRWGQGSSKTIYDPCPAGYRIPEYNSSDLLWKDVTSNGTFVVNGDHGWWKVGTSFIFPMAGDGGYDYAEHAYDRNKLWTAKQLSDSKPQHGVGQYIFYETGDDKDTWDGVGVEGGYWASVPDWGVRKRYFASVRCQKIEGEVEPDPKVAATGITINGDTSDWTNGDTIPGDGDRIIEWKYSSNNTDLLFYFKIARSCITYETDEKSSSYLKYDKKRYIYVAINTDNKTSSGPATPGYGGLVIPGCDALALVYPFRGTYGEEGAPSFINGVDALGWIMSPIGASVDGNVTAYGNFSGDYAYLEIAIPRAKIGNPSGRAKIQLSLSWNCSGIYAIDIPAPSL